MLTDKCETVEIWIISHQMPYSVSDNWPIPLDMAELEAGKYNS